MSLNTHRPHAWAGVSGLTALALFAIAAPATSASKDRAISDQRTASQKADAAVAAGATGVRKALRSGDVEVGIELLKRATVTRTQTTAPELGRLAVCHGPVRHRETVSLAGISMGWREVRLAGWCWGGGEITSWQGVSYSDDTAPLYCWTNESEHDGWYNHPTRRYTFSRGTLGGNSGFGCVAVGNTISPAIYYRDGGSWSYTP